jgi:hypothetical protein
MVKPRATWWIGLTFISFFIFLTAYASAQKNSAMPTIDRVEVDFGGGPGGSAYASSECPPGYVGVAFKIISGNYTDNIAVGCRRIVNADYVLGDNTYYMTGAGGSGGDLTRISACNNTILHQITGKTGFFIDAVQGQCSSGPDIASSSSPSSTPSPLIDVTGSGSPASAACPQSFAVTGFKIRYGAWIDHLWIICSRITQEATVPMDLARPAR